MGLEAALQALTDHLLASRTLAGELALIIDDRPAKSAHALADALSDAAQDVLGWLHEIHEIARMTQLASRDVDATRRGLTQCESLRLKLEQRWEELDSRRSELASLAKRRPAAWSSWRAAVDASIDRLSDQLSQLPRRLGDSWRELAERLPQGNIAIYNSNIGAQATTMGAQYYGEETQDDTCQK